MLTEHEQTSMNVHDALFMVHLLIFILFYILFLYFILLFYFFILYWFLTASINQDSVHLEFIAIKIPTVGQEKHIQKGSFTYMDTV